MLFGTLGAGLLGNMSAGKGMNRTSHGSKGLQSKKKRNYKSRL